MLRKTLHGLVERILTTETGLRHASSVLPPLPSHARIQAPISTPRPPPCSPAAYFSASGKRGTPRTARDRGPQTSSACFCLSYSRRLLLLPSTDSSKSHQTAAGCYYSPSLTRWCCWQQHLPRSAERLMLGVDVVVYLQIFSVLEIE